jgi:hypothetical protein
MSKPEITGEIRNDRGQFVKGMTGNPNGRPKGSFSLVEMIKRKLQEVPEGKDKTYAEYFIEQLMKKSVIEGDTSTMKDIINRVDGMPRQNIGVDGGAEGVPVSILNNVLSNNSNKQNTEPEPED